MKIQFVNLWMALWLYGCHRQTLATMAKCCVVTCGVTSCIRSVVWGYQDAVRFLVWAGNSISLPKWIKNRHFLLPAALPVAAGRHLVTPRRRPAGITYIHSTHKYRKAGYSVVDRAKNGPFFHALLCLAFAIHCSRKDFALLLRTWGKKLEQKVNGIVATRLCPHDTLV
jgi:hypothetical protein